MKFPYTYFEDEVREGFYVSSIMKRIWAAQMEVLQVVDEICKKHNLKWFADGGTLLGAIRHGGYIPWDDDLDISMLREDYDRFNQIIQSELPDKYVWLNHNNVEEPRYQFFTRITNSHELEFDNEHLVKYHQCPYVVGIDIFVIDYLSDDESKELQRERLLKLAMPLAKTITPEGDNVETYRDKLEEIENLCNVNIDYNGNVKRQLFDIVDGLCSRFTYDGGKYVAMMAYWVQERKYRYPAACFDSIVMKPFEVTKLPLPVDYDGVLRVEYGDYMKIVKEGGDHNYPVFIQQEEHLISVLPEYHFRYKYSKEHLENPVRTSYDSPKIQVEKFVRLMEKAHDLIIKNIEFSHYEGVEQLLITCQNSAIKVGTMLEEVYGEGLATVKTLEEYCELLYQISVMLQESKKQNNGMVDEGNNIGTEVLRTTLHGILNDLIKSEDDKVFNRKRILFIGYKAGAWNAFEDMWNRANEDTECDVEVMPVPYYELDALGIAREMHYEGQLYPDYLNIVDYRTYDIEKKHPDVIIIQNPYDECNYTTTIMQYFYSERLKGFTDKLVYVPWFKLDEFGEGDTKARQTMKYFCEVPGLIHADVVVVQSENMRREYIRCLAELAGEETREIWEKKVVTIMRI